MEFTSPICKQTKSPQKGIVAVEDGMIRGFDRKYFYIRPAERPSAKDVFNLPNPGVCTLPCTAWPSTLLSWQERPGAAVNELVKPGHSAIRAIHRCSFIPLAAKQKVDTPTNTKTTNAKHNANHELRQKTGNSTTIVNSAEMVAIKPTTAVKSIDFCNTW
jgi:hypothetical protein